MTTSLRSSGLDTARLVEELADRLQAGGDAEAFIAEHPDHADALRRVLPAVRMMADLSQSAADGSWPGADDLPNVELGDYRIVREVGRGGMGIVYEAEQLSLRRRVALKVLPFAAAMDPKQLQRFKNEALAAASLKHEHIVQVYAVGCERGVHFYAMEFIDGMTLAQVIPARQRGGPTGEPAPHTSCSLPPCGGGLGWGVSESTPHPNPPPQGGREQKPETATLAALSTEPGGRRGKEFYRRAAELIADAADALEHAHSLGVVHRDVKPGNLLLDGSGKVYVSDFGLARFGPDAGLTMSGDMLGTLRYMSPEQALAKHGLVDHRADVYSLGATLYELLTLRPAVAGDDKAEILKHIAFEEPVTLRKVDRAIPAELETMCHKCLAKEPTERYATAGELVDDLRRFLDDKPIRAKRPTLRQRLARWGRSHPGLTAAAGLVAGLLLAGGWAWNREATQADAAARAVAAEADQFRAADRLPEALQAARRAADLLPRFGGDAATRRAIGERVADLQLLNRLEEARLEAAVERPGTWTWDLQRVRPLLQKAFEDYGVDITTGDEAAIVDSLSRAAITDQVVGGLLQWEAFAVEQGEKLRFGRLADALDSDPRRLAAKARLAGQAGDIAALKRLAAEAEADLPSRVAVSKLGSYLQDHNALADAERLLRAGQRSYPSDFWINFGLAEAIHRRGTAPDPNPATIRNIDPTRAAEAIPFYTAAIALRPQSASVWSNTGIALISAGRFQESAYALRRAIALKPDYHAPYLNLAVALANQGQFAEAEEACRRAIARKSSSALAHNNLAAALVKLKKFAEAEVSFRRAIELKHDDAMTHAGLGVALRRLGRYEEALAAFRRCRELAGQQGRPEASFAWVRDEERKATLAGRLPALVAGEAQPADTAERLALAQICAEQQALYAAASARFYAAAFAAEPKLFDNLQAYHRHNAACMAARAGCGQSADAAKLPNDERTRLRQKALVWLSADFAARTKTATTPDGVQKLRRVMQHWQNDPDFAGVRDAAALSKLPETEQLAWQKLWDDVADLLRRLDAAAPEQPPSTP